MAVWSSYPFPRRRDHAERTTAEVDRFAIALMEHPNYIESGARVNATETFRRIDGEGPYAAADAGVVGKEL